MLRNCLMRLVCNVTRSVWDITHLSDVRRLSDQAYVSKDVWCSAAVMVGALLLLLLMLMFCCCDGWCSAAV